MTLRTFADAYSWCTQFADRSEVTQETAWLRLSRPEQLLILRFLASFIAAAIGLGLSGMWIVWKALVWSLRGFTS